MKGPPLGIVKDDMMSNVGEITKLPEPLQRLSHFVILAIL